MEQLQVLREKFGLTKRHNKLYCFNPPVMIATFIIEISLAIYTVCRYKFNAITRLASLLFVFLALFQLAEFIVCRGSEHSAMLWSRVGYVAITMLPPLGLHLALVIAKVKPRIMWAMLPAYVTAAAYVIFFGFTSNALAGHECLGNYVIFQVAAGMGVFYGTYYYGWILATILTCIYFSQQTMSKVVKRGLLTLLVGYAAFLIPAASVYYLSPATLKGIPSIMCGFAIIMAVTVAFAVLPQVDKRR